MDISNKTLAYVLIAAVAVSLFGTILSLNKVGQITGFATNNQTGIASVNISSSGSVSFTTSAINFGAGAVNSTFNNCTLTTNNFTVVAEPWKYSGCVNFSATRPSDFVLENNGNKNVSLSIYSNTNASSFIGGGTGSNVPPLFQYIVVNNEASSCASNLTGGSTVWTNFSVAVPGNNICNDFVAANSADTLNISLRLVIPTDAVGGSKTGSVYVVATYS